MCHQKFVKHGRTERVQKRRTDTRTDTQEPEREKEWGRIIRGVTGVHCPCQKNWSLTCPALSGQVAFKVTYVGVSYESSAIIKESHSACPTAPCPAARFQPGAIISKRHACQQHSKLLCGLMVFSWLLLANTYLYMLYTFLLVSQQQPLLLTLVT